MSIITMDQIAVMSVQYVHYTFDYYLDSMHQCGIKNLDLWGGSPHYCRLDYLTSSSAERKLLEMRRKAESLGMKYVMYNAWYKPCFHEQRVWPSRYSKRRQLEARR